MTTPEQKSMAADLASSHKPSTVRRRFRTWAALCLAAALAAMLPSSPAAAPAAPDDYPKLLAPTAEVIATALAGEPTRRAADKARVAAVLLAESAQQKLDGPDGAQRAAVRNATLAIAVLVKDKQYPEAIKQAKLLSTLTAKPGVSKARVKIGPPLVDVDLLMGPFRSVRLGGYALEDRLDELGSSPGGMLPPAALNDDLRLLAYRTALVAELTRVHAPDEKAAKAWQTYCDAMRRGALDLIGAVQAKDSKAAFSAVEAVNQSCKQCHKEFRK